MDESNRRRKNVLLRNRNLSWKFGENLIERKLCNNNEGVVTEKKFGRGGVTCQRRVSMEKHWLDDNRQRERATL